MHNVEEVPKEERFEYVRWEIVMMLSDRQGTTQCPILRS